jgi:arylsulfatase A-like enzyme
MYCDLLTNKTTHMKLSFSLLLGIFLISFSFLHSCNTGQKSNKQKPNIILFYVDDMGWQDCSLPFHSETTRLNRIYHTPNMEALAKEGMKFTQAYAYAVCSPSRISLMTGMNGARHQVTNWTLRMNKSPDPEHKEITPPEWNMNGMTQGEEIPLTVQATTMPQLLKEAGYRTIHAGKAHWGAMGTPGENPLNLGFDVNIGGHAAGGPGSYHGEYNYSAAWRNADRIWDVPGLEKYHGTDTYLTEALTLEAKAEIDRALEDNKPFYLYMSHYAIHAPWEADSTFYNNYLVDGINDFEAIYASMIEGMDKSLGDLMKKMKEKGQWENTIIIFMSDNGQPKNATLNKPLRGHKLLPYEGGIRVPLIVYWPGHAAKGSENSQYVMVDDLFPTILQMAGVDHSKVMQVVDGKSFVPYLEDPELRDETRPLFWHFPHTYDQFPYSTVRKGDWKLIYRHLDQSLELYNIRTDLSETSNMAEEEAEIKNELATLLSDYLREVNAGMPILSETNKSVPYPDEVE